MRPLAYVEAYRVARDVIAEHHPIAAHDLGIHLAIGDPDRTGRGLGPECCGWSPTGCWRPTRPAGGWWATPRPATRPPGGRSPPPGSPSGRGRPRPQAGGVDGLRPPRGEGFTRTRSVRYAIIVSSAYPRWTGPQPVPGRPVSARLVGMGAVTGYGWGWMPWSPAWPRRSPRRTTPRSTGSAPGPASSPTPTAGRCRPTTATSRAVAASVDEAVADAEARGWVPGDAVGAHLLDRHLRHPHAARQLLQRRPPAPPQPVPAHAAHGDRLDRRHAARVDRAEPRAQRRLLVGQRRPPDGRAVAALGPGHRRGRGRRRAVPGRRRSSPGSGACGCCSAPTGSLADCRPFQEGSRGFFLGEAAVATVVTGEGRADGGLGHLPGRRHHPRCLPPRRSRARGRPARPLPPRGAGGRRGHGRRRGRGQGARQRHAAQRPGRGGARRPHVPGPHPPVQLQAAARPRHGGRRPHRDGRPASPATRAGACPSASSDEAAHPRLADGEPVPDGLALCLRWASAGPTRPPSSPSTADPPERFATHAT